MYNCKKSCRSFFCIFVGVLLFLGVDSEEVWAQKSDKDAFIGFSDLELRFFPNASIISAVFGKDSDRLSPNNKPKLENERFNMVFNNITSGFATGLKLELYNYHYRTNFGANISISSIGFNIDERTRRKTSIHFSPYVKMRVIGDSKKSSGLLVVLGYDINRMLRSNYKLLDAESNLDNFSRLSKWNSGPQIGLGFITNWKFKKNNHLQEAGRPKDNKKVELLFVYHHLLNNVFNGQTPYLNAPATMSYFSFDFTFPFPQ